MTSERGTRTLEERISGLSPEKRALLTRLLSEEPAGETRTARGDDASFELSFGQRRLWFLDRLEPSSGAFNIASGLVLSGPLDVDALERSLLLIIERHEVLRTAYVEEGGVPVSRVMPVPASSSVLEIQEPGGSTEGERRHAAESRFRELGRRPFDLSCGVLLRVFVSSLSGSKHLLGITVHHIVFDAWSVGVLYSELFAAYDAFSRGERPVLPKLPCQYRELARRERERASSPELQRQLEYWVGQLRDLPSELSLPTDRPRGGSLLPEAGREGMVLPLDLASRAKELGRSEGASLFMTLLAVFELLLSRHSGQDDVVVGTPISGRHRPEAHPLIGFFVNNLVLRARVSERLTFRELLRHVRDVSREAFANQEVPFEKLVETLRPERALNRNPLFQVVFTLQPATAPTKSTLDVEPLRVVSERVRYELELYTQESTDGLRLWCLYDRHLFDAATVSGLVEDFRFLLERVTAEPDVPLGRLDLLRPDVRETLERWNKTTRAYPDSASLPELFRDSAREHGERVALELDDEFLTYAELDRRSNRLARVLRDKGVGPDVAVGLCLERSPATIVAMLAVVKAGGAYVPLDADYPAARLAFMAEDAGLCLILTETRFLSRLPELQAEVFCLDTENAAMSAVSSAPLVPRSGPDDLVYVMYTSGSTGVPKGVEVTARAIARLLFGSDTVALGPEERILGLAPLAFDASTFEIWGALLHGGRLVLFPERVPTAASLAAVLRAKSVSTLWLTGALFNAVVDERPDAFGSCRQVLAGGEALSVPHVMRAQASCPGTRFINGYGPTEGTTFSCCYPIPKLAVSDATSIPIGPPLANTTAHVLDRNLEPVPVGAPGELYIGGDGLARGYRLRPALTAERFIPDPSGTSGARLYRTGDRVRFRRDGALEFLGRMDHQVKLRGFRVEPGEIEAALRGEAEVRDAAVVVRKLDHGELQLVGYWVPSTGVSTAFDERELRRRLAERLPVYMMPARLVRMEALPLTSSGKLDRLALSEAPAETASARDVRAARGPVEETLAAIFEEVLATERQVGIDEDFFELGGHSLLATRLIARIRETFSVELPLRAMFETPTVAALAQRVEAARGASTLAKDTPLERLPREAALPLTYSQHRLWFLEELLPGSAAYNIAGALRFHGKLSERVLSRALTAIVERHESLRSAFGTREGKAVLRILPARPRALPVIDLSMLPRVEREACAERIAAENAVLPFDIAKGDVFRTRLVRLDPEDNVLLLSMHHIVSDAWSLGVLVRELGAFYRAFETGESSALPELECQVVDYAAWQRRYLSGERLSQELGFWREALRDLEPLELPTDRPRPAVPTFKGAREVSHLPKALAERLEALGRESGATLFMTLLAAFQALCSRLSGQSDIVVGTPIANRRRREVYDLIGFFANNLVMRADVSGSLSFTSLLRQVRERALDAFDHQDVPFEKLVDELAPERDLSRNPLFQITFSLQTATVEKLELPGLTLGRLPSEALRTRFDLELNVFRQADGLSLVAFYSTDLFDAATIERLLRQYRLVLESIVARPERSVSELPLLTPEERARTLAAWMERAPTSVAEETLATRFQRVAREHRDALALVEPGEWGLTYGELARATSAWARRLRALGAGPEIRVGICLERSANLVIAVLAVLESGAAYVPLDPDYPEERLSFLIEDAAPLLILTDAAGAARLASQTTRKIRIDVEDDGSDGRPFQEGAVTRPHPDNTAYIIYTSGSTGRPKGVAVTHRNVLRLMDATEPWFRFGPEDAVPLFHSFAFDFSVWEIFGALLYGARLVVVPYWVSRSPDAMVALAREQKLTVLNQTPSAFRQFARAEAASASGGEGELDLRLVVFGGEALSIESLRPWIARHGDARPRLVNMYGITETTVHVTYRPITRDDLEASWRSVIGGPIPDLGLYLLDDNLEPVPPGVAGEVYVGGAGLARGYWMRPDVTAERFVPNPFATAPGDRLYRSGDLARYRENGEVEYVGRRDHQVKVRGFRIELGEIEAALVAHPFIDDAVVSLDVHEHGHERLIAHIVPAREGDIVSALRDHLKRTLPEHMVPATFAEVAEIPMTAHGKVDHVRLRELARPAEAASQAGRTPPRTEAEKQLAAIWSEMLGVAEIRLEDNFFELGGDSILSIQVVSRAKERGLSLSARDLFQHQTLGALASVADSQVDHVEDSRELELEAIGSVPLTPIQRWFFADPPEELHHYNQSMLLELSEERTRLCGVVEALGAIARRHDVFRLRFHRRVVDGKVEWTQERRPSLEGGASIATVDLSALDDSDRKRTLEAASARAQTSLSLENGPLARFVLFGLGRGHGARLLLALHHLAVDGVSWRILLDELRRALAGQERGLPVELALGRRPTSYARWADYLARQRDDDALAAQTAFWNAQGAPGPALPLDFGGGDNREASLAHVRVGLDEVRTRKLLRELPVRYRAHIDEVLLTALAAALHRFTGEEAVPIDLEGHGREELFGKIDVSGTLGWFTCLYPVRLPTPGTGDLPATLRAVRAMVRAVPDKGMGYGLTRVSGSEPRSPQVSFNYLGQMDSAFDAGGFFRPARESVGPVRSPRARRRHVLDVSAVVASGRLQMDWMYASTLHRRETIERLAQDYLGALEALIASEASAGETEKLSPSDFDLVTIDAKRLERIVSRAGGDDVIEDIHPLSPLQQGMLFHGLYAPGSKDYLVQVAWKLTGPLQVEAFEQAWNDVVSRHTILRTAFDWASGEEPLGVVHRETKVDLPFALVQTEESLEDFMARERVTPLDTARAPLMRVTVLRTDAKTHHFVWTFHHLLLDGWSLGRVLREVFTGYEARRDGHLSPVLLEPATPFRHYIAWLAGRDPSASERFWRDALEGLEAPTPLGLDEAGPLAEGEATHGDRSLVLDRTLSEALRALSRAHKLTLSTIFQGLWAFLASRYSGETDIVFGSTVSGRPADLEGVESVVGLFINTIPARVAVRDDARLADWLAHIQAAQAEAREHAHLPLVEVQGQSAVPRGTPLFESLFVFENFPVDRSLRNGRRAGDGKAELRASDFRFWTQTSYPLHFRVRPGREIVLDVTFDRTRFSDAGVERLLEHYHEALRATASDPERPVRSLLAPASPASKPSPIGAPVSWSEETSLLARLARVAAERSEAPAVVTDGHHFTYRMLDGRARSVAAKVAAIRAGGERIALLFDHDAPMIAAMLGVLRAGCAYVPLDPRYPIERLRYMLEDARASALVLDPTHAGLAGELASDRIPRICLDLEDEVRAAPEGEPGTDVEPDSLAYLLYTSGSTGRPKGTMQSQRNVLVHARNYASSLGLRPSDRLTLLSSYGFDASVMSIWGGLTSGASVHPFDLRARGLAELGSFLDERGITVYHSTPTVFRYFLDTLAEERCFPTVRAVVLGGEEVTARDVERYRRHFTPECVLLNGLGPTESTVSLQYFLDHETPVMGRRVPVGFPVPGIEVRLLDGDGHEAPVVGEIALSGAQVALGYWERPAETRTAFTTESARPEDGAQARRTYRTGDRGRLRPDGAIEFLGRKDARVKLRGHRIELGEIEAVIARAPGVAACAVSLVATDGSEGDEPFLVAYVVSPKEPSAPLDEDGLREAARSELPDYMVPSLFVSLDALPSTPTGKIDRRALPAPAARPATARQSDAEAEPRTPIEEELVAIWKAVLKRERVGIKDSFFDLGGHSLLATRVAMRIQEAFDVQIPLRWLFERPTVEALALGILERLLEEEPDALDREAKELA